MSQHAKRAFIANRTVAIVAERGQSFNKDLRTFEDRLSDDETVAVLNYGSNSPESLRKTFHAAGVDETIRFGGHVKILGMAIAYGSTCSRGHSVATLEDAPGNVVTGWILLATKAQFTAIAKRECGDSLGREASKGHYRRAVIWIADPRAEGGKLMQILAFVLREKHPKVIATPPTSSTKIRKDLGITRADDHPFNAYTRMVDAQRKSASEMQADLFKGEPSILGFWNSRDLR